MVKIIFFWGYPFDTPKEIEISIDPIQVAITNREIYFLNSDGQIYISLDKKCSELKKIEIGKEEKVLKIDSNSTSIYFLTESKELFQILDINKKKKKKLLKMLKIFIYQMKI